jgi:hypothetical protein
MMTTPLASGLVAVVCKDSLDDCFACSLRLRSSDSFELSTSDDCWTESILFFSNTSHKSEPDSITE